MIVLLLPPTRFQCYNEDQHKEDMKKVSILIPTLLKPELEMKNMNFEISTRSKVPLKNHYPLNFKV